MTYTPQVSSTSTAGEWSLALMVRWVPLVACSVMIGLGCTTLFGWAFGVQELTHVSTQWVAMKFNTALGFILGGVSLWIQRDERVESLTVKLRVAQVLGLLVAGLGAITFFEYVSGISLGIDQLVLTQQGGAGARVPWARMSRAAAAAFVVLGLALVGLHERRSWLRRPVPWLAAAGMVIGLVAFAGYLYGVKSLHSFLPFYAMAAHTSVAFILFGVGILCVRTGGDPTSVVTSELIGGVMARRMLPLAVVLPLVMGWLRWKGEQRGLYGTELGLALYATATILIFVFLICTAAWWLNGTDARRQVADTKLHELNAELEERVKERTWELEQANKELEAFSYSVSHDLRAPLRAVDGFSQALVEDFGPSLPPEAKRYLMTVRNETLRMGELIDDLLTFSRLSRAPLARQTVDTRGLVAALITDLKMQQAARGAVVVELGEMAACEGDPALLRQVWLNLLSNAFKYTSKQEKPVVTVGERLEGGERVYFVKDNGAGFDMRYAHKLFGVFQRLHRSEDYDGTGVGLAIVQRIVHRHGGRVWAEAAVNRGATFYFTLNPRHHEHYGH